VAVALIAAVGLAACNMPVEIVWNPTETPSAPGAVLFQDDFAEVPGSWGTWNRPGAVISYEKEGLRVVVSQTNADFWSVAGKRFRDVSISVEATCLDGPSDNDFGVICRYQDRKNFYMFLVSSDGYYGIAKMKDDRHSLIGTEQLQYSGDILPAQTMHRLQADCVGDRLSLSVDGRLLLTVEDGDYTSGDVGLLAGAYSTPGVDVLFDHFVVKQP
jgi:hypothetical protein